MCLKNCEFPPILVVVVFNVLGKGKAKTKLQLASKMRTMRNLRDADQVCILRGEKGI